MDRTDLLNKVAAAMQDEIGVTGDPTGDYDIAISSAAVVAVDVLGAELGAARARVAAVLARCDEIDEACQQHVHRHIYTQTVRELLTGS